MPDTAESILKELWEVKQEEDDYRFRYISCYNTPEGEKIPSEVRAKWIDDLKILSTKQQVVWEKIRTYFKEKG